MRIEANISAVHGNRLLKATNNSLSKSMEKLSSGKSINKASDDAAGLAISEKLKAQMTGINRATANAYDGISMVKTADSALESTHAALQSMRETAVQAANGTLTNADREKLQAKVNQLSADIDKIADTTEFNTQKLLDGSLSEGFELNINPNAGEGGEAPMKVGDFSAEALGLANLDLTTTEGANAAIEAIDKAIDTVTSQRAELGSAQNHLEYSINNLATTSQNLMSAGSQISDVDMAEEFSEMTRQNILSQANIAMLAQANKQSANVLNLFN